MTTPLALTRHTIKAMSKVSENAFSLQLVFSLQLALSPQTKPGNSDDKQEEARDGGDHDVEHTGVAINTVDHGSFCGKLFLKRKTLATASRGPK